MNARSRRPLSWQPNRQRKLWRRLRRRPRRKLQTPPAERHPRCQSRRGGTWSVSSFLFHSFPKCADALQTLRKRSPRKSRSSTSIRSRKSRNFRRKLRSATRPSTKFGSTCAARVTRFLGSPLVVFLPYVIPRPPASGTVLLRRFLLQATSLQLHPVFLASEP